MLSRPIHRLNRLVAGASRSAEDDEITRQTHMFRNIPQLRLLAKLLSASNGIVNACIYGVADGSEAVSLLVMLDPSQTGVSVSIDGFDLREDYIRQAERFLFTSRHFPPLSGPLLTTMARYFERPATDMWRLKPEWHGAIRYAVDDVTAVPGHDDAPKYDLVMCQNVLIGMTAHSRELAINNLVRLVRPDGFLAVGGGPLGEIPALVLGHGFEPVLDDVELIHEAWKTQRKFYDNPKRPFWALEPFDSHHSDGPVRYCTLFRKPKETT